MAAISPIPLNSQELLEIKTNRPQNFDAARRSNGTWCRVCGQTFTGPAPGHKDECKKAMDQFNKEVTDFKNKTVDIAGSVVYEKGATSVSKRRPKFAIILGKAVAFK